MTYLLIVKTSSSRKVSLSPLSVSLSILELRLPRLDVSFSVAGESSPPAGVRVIVPLSHYTALNGRGPLSGKTSRSEVCPVLIKHEARKEIALSYIQFCFAQI